MEFSVKKIQKALNSHGYTVTVDGIMGPETEAAITTFKHKNGLRSRALIGSRTLRKLFRTNKAPPPWVTELSRHMHLHEDRDNEELRKWLKSDGATLGDPAEFPWCGDAIHTAIRLTLPNEPFPGALGKNPYWARNWALFGEKTDLSFGAIVVLTRGSGGHVGIAVGYDRHNKRIRVRGGNQSNSISDTWMGKKRVIAYRKPKTWKQPLDDIPIMDSSGQIIPPNGAE